MHPLRSVGSDRSLSRELSRRRVLGALGGVAGLGVALRPARLGAITPGLATESRANDGSGLRDFGATTALLGLSSEFEDFAVTGDHTILTAGAAQRAQQLDLEVVNFFYGDLGLRQKRHDTFFNESGSERLYLSQYQFPDPDSAATGFGELGRILDYPGAADAISEIPGQTQSVARQFSFQTEQGEEIDRLNTVVQRNEYLLAGTFDAVPAIGSAANRTERALNALATLMVGYDDDKWGGVISQDAQIVTSTMPLLEGVEEHRYYYGLAGGRILPRYRGDAARTAAENPGVEYALFGTYSLNDGPFPITVYFGARSLQDILRSDEYWEQLPKLMQNNGSGVNWQYLGPDSESELPNYVHAGIWNPAEGVQLVGAHMAAQLDSTVVDIGAFAPYSGAPADFPDVDPTGEREYEPLSRGLAELINRDYEETLRSFQAGYQPPPTERPSYWQ